MKLRIGLKWKIFAGATLLSLSIVGASIVHTNRVIERASARQGELDAIYRRYQAYQRIVSDGYAATIDAWAISSQELVKAMARGDDEAAGPLIHRVTRSLEEDLRPDFVVVVDKHGCTTVVPDGGPLSREDVASMRLFADLHNRAKIKNALLNHNGVAFVVNGAPVLSGDENVGSIVIGRKLGRYFDEFKAQSDTDEKRQVDLGLIGNGGTTLAASLHAGDWDDLARAVQRNPRETDWDGSEHIEVLRLPDGLHDFASAVRNGYDGALPGTVGTLYVLRNRTDHAERLARLLHDNLVVGALAVLFSFVASFALAMGVARPIRRLVVATEEIAHGHGDLTKRVEDNVCVRRSDEIGDLAHNLNAMLGNLQHLASGVQQASLQVGASSAEISAASKQMLDGAKDQAVKIESSTAAVTELSSSIQQVADNAMQAGRVAKESGDQVQAAIDGMARIRATVDDAAGKILDLGESGKRIGNIVEVIRQISEQTTLLALNASIEAAHAGEQGRGFAVVANEVSSLARRVGQSAKDIEDLIATIKDQTAQAVTSMQSGKQEVEGGTHLVHHTLTSLKQIVEVVQDTATAVQEQAVVSDEIARNMDAVQKIAQEVLASSEEAVVQGETLHTLAGALEESVRGFRLDEDGRRGAAPLAGDGRLPPQPPTQPQLPAIDRRKTARG